MPGPTTVDDGALVLKDPADVRVYQFDWDARHLATGVEISSSTFTLTTVKGLNTTALTKDNESLLTGNRKTQLRLTAGTKGSLYDVTNRITTNEAPSQTFERSFRLLIEDR